MITERRVIEMTQVNFRIDDELKANAEQALKEMGLTMSSAITIFLVKVARERRIPFEITADFYGTANVVNIKDGTSTLKEHDLIEVED